MDLPNIDKVQGVIIRIRSNENSEESKNILISMLEELLKKEVADVKKKRLSEKYGLEMTRDTEEKVNVMCNLSDVVLEKGFEKGIDSTIENMLTSGSFTDEQICVATGKTMDYIIEFKKKIKNK